ncbi:hypothetical protein HQQ80_01265 [Microbacteriaceae bacterium VKM Ac-2855]|nr:hypothetical protein [Microbacteriaceae bacterium VKM Ac-2855]
MTAESPPAAREFDHVILTRFNVRFGEYAPPNEDDWLFYRWAFFRDALAASAASQTVRDFQWLVFFDIDTPAWLRDEIDELSPGLFAPRFVAVWSNEVAQQAVAEVAVSPYLITTRIDSDDAIATRFVADVQSRFERQTSLYINFLCGVQVERTGELYRYDEPSNPFLSYIEKRDGEQPRTVFRSLRHGESAWFADVLNIVGPPRWMQVIHGTNVANGVRGLRVRPEIFGAEFELDLPFDRTVSTSRYRRERVRSAFDLARLWVLHPYYFREYLHARRLRLAGTQLIPRTEVLAKVRRRPAWLRLMVGPLRRSVHAADDAWRRRRNRRRSTRAD